MQASKSVGSDTVRQPEAIGCDNCSMLTLPFGRTTTPRIPSTWAAYAAMAAEVSPVEAQATWRTPRWRAHDTPALMPRSLNDRVGFSPSCLMRTSRVREISLSRLDG